MEGIDHTLNSHFSRIYYNITLSQQTTMRSNDTLGNTRFQLISDFFHVNKVFSVEQASSRGVLEGGGGGGGGTGLLNKGGRINRLPGLVTINNKLWNFIRYWLVANILL